MGFLESILSKITASDLNSILANYELWQMEYNKNNQIYSYQQRVNAYTNLWHQERVFDKPLCKVYVVEAFERYDGSEIIGVYSKLSYAIQIVEKKLSKQFTEYRIIEYELNGLKEKEVIYNSILCDNPMFMDEYKSLDELKEELKNIGD